MSQTQHERCCDEINDIPPVERLIRTDPAQNGNKERDDVQQEMGLAQEQLCHGVAEVGMDPDDGWQRVLEGLPEGKDLLVHRP